MTVFGQAYLLLKKNVLLRIRYPGVFALELIWPVLVMGLVALMRNGAPPFRKPTCHYQPRAMPSAGAVPFLQTYMCNLDNPCFITEKELEDALSASRSFSALTQDAAPYLASPETIEVLDISNQSVRVINTMNAVIGDQNLTQGLDTFMNVSQYFRDPDEAKRVLVDEFRIFTPEEADGLLNARINIGEVLKLTGSPDYVEVACDPAQLSLYLQFPATIRAGGAASVADISRALCNISEADVPGLAGAVVGQLDVVKLMEALQLFETLKEKFTGSSLALIFNELAELFELVMNSKSVVQALGGLASVPDISRLIRDIPDLMEGFNNLKEGLASVKHLVDSLDPLMVSLGLDDSHAWSAARNAVAMGTHFVLLGEQKWNGTTQEFMEPLVELIANLRAMAQNESTRAAVSVLEFLSQQNWPDIYSQIMATSALDEKTLVHMLTTLDQMLQTMQGYDIVTMVTRLTQHALDVGSIFTEQSIELRRALLASVEGTNALQERLNTLLNYGPDVAQAILESAFKSQFFTNIFSGRANYTGVCHTILMDLHNRVPAVVADDVRKVLCTEDPMNSLAILGNDPTTSAVSAVINETVEMFTELYEGDFWAKQVAMSDLYQHFNRFNASIHAYLDDVVRWEDILQRSGPIRVDFNEPGWERLLDMLNEDYLLRGILGMYQGFGNALTTSPLAGQVAPYVHVMSRTVEMTYRMMFSLTQTYSVTSPLMTAVRMATMYLPELIQGVAHMTDGNMDVVYRIAASPDPLSTFCQEDVLGQMAMPSYVPVGEMTDLVCKTNWTQVIVEFVQPVTQIQDMVTQMVAMIESLGDPAALPQYDAESEWIAMVDYTQRLIDMFNSGDVGNMDFTLGYLNYIDSIDFDKLGQGFGLAVELLLNDTAQDMEGLTEVALGIMSSLDRSMGSDPGPEWRMVRVYAIIIDSYLDMQLALTERSTNISSIRQILSMYPAEFTQMTELLAKAYPQTVAALRNIILYPEWYLDHLSKLGFRAPDCVSRWVSDYFMLAQDSSLHDLERYICGLDMEQLAASLAQATPEIDAYMETIQQVSLDPTAGMNETVDWAVMAKKIEKYIAGLDTQMSFGSFGGAFDLSPFNATSISLSWEDLYRAIDTYRYFDTNRIQAIATKLSEVATQTALAGFDPNDLDAPMGMEVALALLYGNSYISYHFVKLANAELNYFNGKDTVVLSEYLWSDELTSILGHMEKSPEFGAVVMATVARLLRTPDQAKLPTDVEALCTDLQLFSQVFVVSASSMPASEMQSIICDVINIDFEKVLDEVLNNRASVKEFVDAINLLTGNFTVEDLRVNATQMAEQQASLTRLIDELIRDPPTVQLTPDQSWLDMSAYTRQWENLTQTALALGDRLNDPRFVRSWESDLTTLVVTTIASDPSTGQALAYVDAILDILVRQLDDNSGNLDELRKYPNANIVLELVEQAPEAIETIVYTVITQQAKTSRWGFALQSWPAFCSTPVEEIMSVPPGANFSMALFLAKACSLDVEALAAEMAAYQGTDRLEAIMINGTQGAVNLTSIVHKVDSVVEYFPSLANPAPGNNPIENLPFDRLYDERVWNRIGGRMAVWANMTAAQFDSPAVITATIAQALKDAFGGLATDVFEIVDKAIGVTDLLLEQIIITMDTNSLNASFHEMPEMQLLAGLLNEVPELFETVLYTATQNPDKITQKLMQADSLESFCRNSPQDMLMVAPNSTFDFAGFLGRFCSLNLTQLVTDLETYSVTQQLNDVLNGPYTGPANVDSLIDKVEQLVARLDRGINPRDRVFDPNVWSQVLGRTSTWIWDDNTSPTEYIKLQQKRLLQAFATFVENTPGAEDMLHYMDAILDVMAASTGSLEELRQYPNANILLQLIDQAPEAIETILYTVMTQQAKTSRWGFALQSWPAFCSTPVEEIMSVPPGANFSMALFLAKACSLDVEALAAEMAAYQGTDRLTRLLMEGPGNWTNVNMTVLGHKLDRLVDYSVSIADPSGGALASLPFQRLFNEAVWDQIGQRVAVWANTAASFFDSPSKIADTIASSLQDAFGMLATDVLEIVQKVVGISDLIVDQMTSLMDTNSLNASFHELPELQAMADLLNQVPELYENVLYTAIHHPEKITSKLAGVDSLESFCRNNPQDMLVMAPNSTFDLQSFLMQFCSLNLTQLVTDLETFSVTQQLNDVLNGPYSPPIDFTSLISKSEQLAARFQQGISPGDRVFDPSVWEKVMDRTNTWLWTYENPMDFVAIEQQRLFLSLIAYVENTPGSEDMLRYIDAVLDVLGDRLAHSQTDLASAVKDLPNLSTLVGLLEQLPEMLETAAYTVLTQSAKTAAWGSALTSFEALCNTPVSSIMSVPPGSSFDVAAYIGQLCSIDTDRLASELTQYQGFGRLEAIASGNDTSAVNTTAVLIKADRVFTSLAQIYSNPDAAMDSDLRVFNLTVWENVGQNIQGWLTAAQVDCTQPENIVQAVSAVFDSLSAMSPEVADVLNRAAAMAAVLVDEVNMVIQESSLKDAYAGIPSLQPLISLANQAPEIYLTVIYTNLFSPEKASAQTNAFMSLETFCAADPESLFTVPPNMNSTFDLKAWVAVFCSLNFTAVEEEITSYHTAMTIQRIVTGQRLDGATNLTALLTKVNQLMERTANEGQGVMLRDRFLNGDVWESAIRRTETWLANLTTDPNPLMYFNDIADTLTQLSQDPRLRETISHIALGATVGEDIFDKLLAVENMTTFGIVEFFRGWTSMESILELAQMPGALEIMTASANSPRFQSLFANQTAYTEFCSPATPPTDYLKAPERSIPMDLQTFKNKFCTIDFDDFMEGFNTFIDLDRITRLLNGSEQMDWRQVFDKLDRVIHLISVTWERNPPMFYLPPHWMNETYWLSFFDTNFASLEDMDSASLKDQVDQIMASLAPLLQTDGLRQIGLVLNSVLDIINDNVLAMQNARYTLGNAVSSVPALKNLFETLGLDNDTLIALLAAPMKNTTLFAEFFLSANFQADFCAVDKWREVLSLPDDFETSGLFQSVCVAGDIDPVLESLARSFNLESLVAALEDPANRDDGWTPAVDKVFELVENMNALLANPPTLDLSDPRLQATLDSYSNTDELWKMLGAFSALRNVFSMNGTNSAGASGLGGLGEELEAVLGVPAAIVGVLTELVARVRLQSGRLDLASVFQGVPQVVAVIDSVLDLKPDPITGLTSVMLRADTVDHLLSMADNETALTEIFCDKNKFMAVFEVRQGVDLAPFLSAMCALDFDTIGQQLMDSLSLSALAGNLSSTESPFNLDQFGANIEKMIGLLMNISSIDYVTFDGRDLGDLGKVNVSRLAEYLNSQYNVEDAFTQDYVAISATVLNDLLTSMGNTSGVPTLALKFIGVFMRNFNEFLRTLQDQPISLALLMNNTEVGAIVNPILADPHLLDGLLNAEIHVKELANLLQSPDVETSLCGPQLWAAIEVPANERQILEDLQSRACAADQEMILWQSIMLQAKGYQIKQQLDAIMQEISRGHAAVNASAVTSEVNQFVELMQNIIQEFMSGSRSINDLVDLRSFQELLDSAQQEVAQRLLNAAESWSVDLADLILPNVLDASMYQSMAKTLNTANLFMNVTIDKLQGIRGGTIGLDSIFTDADDLVSLVEAYLAVGQNIARMWTSGEVDANKLASLLASNATELQTRCTQPGKLAQDLTAPTSPGTSETVSHLVTVLCSVVDGSVLSTAQDFVNYDKIMREMEAIWSSPSVTPNYAAFTANVREFSEIVSDLANRSLTASSELTDSFNFMGFLQDIQNIGENPTVIFQILKLAGLVIEGPLHENQEAVRFMSNINSFAILPMINVLDALKAKGVTLTNIDNPDNLFDILETMLDFDVHYHVIEDVLLKSQLTVFITWQKDYCDAFDINHSWLVGRLSALSLPLPWRNVTNAMCQAAPDADAILDELKQLGLTQSQIVNVIHSVSPVLDPSELPEMYDKNLGWIEIMTNLEQLTALVTHRVDRPGLRSMRNTWDAVKSLVFNKTMHSAFSYLSAFESQIPQTQEWLQFKHFLRFLSSALNFAETNLHGFVQGSAVRLQDILPDSQRVVDLLNNVFGQSSSAEILATVINPEMVYHISLADSWDDVCKNGPQNYLQFPAGVNVTAVTESLCHAVESRSSSFQELLALFGAGDMLTQLNDFLTGNFNTSASNESVWQLAHQAILGLVTTAEQLQGTSVDPQSAETWLAPITNWANSLQTAQSAAGLVGLCNSMIYFVNETREFQMLRQFIAPVISSMQLISDLAKLVPELDEITCIFFGGEEYNLNGAVEKIASLGIWEDIEHMIAMLVSPSTQVDCAAPLNAYQNLSTLIEEAMTVGPEGLDLARLQICLARAPDQLENMLSSVTSTTNFLRQFLDIAQMPGLIDLLQNEEIVPVVEFIIKAFNQNEQVLLQLDDLLADGNRTEEYLVDTVGLPQSLVDAFLAASVSGDWTDFLTKPAQEVALLLCSPAQLSEVLKLPEGSPLNITEVSQMICNLDIMDTAGILTNMSLPLPELENLLPSSTTNLAGVIGDLSHQIGELITEFGNVIELMVGVLTEPSLDMLRGQVDVIDDLLQGRGLTKMAGILNDILDSLVTILPQSADTNVVIEDVRDIFDGLLALDTLTDTVAGEIQVKDLAKDPPGLTAYLTNDLGLSANITETILEATFSSRVFLLTEAAANATCDNVLSSILILNGTGLSPEAVEKALCDLTDAQIQALLDRLVPQLDVGDLVTRYVTHTTKTVLESTNLTSGQLDNMVETIDKGLANLQTASDIFTQNPNTSKILDVFNSATASAVTLSDLTPTICGNDVDEVFAPDFATGGIILTSPETISLDGVSNTDRIELEEMDLPNEFCVEVYKTVRDSSLGNILWSYLKPIMRGKILYTPDTPAVRAILEQANSTFELLDEIHRVSTLWANKAGSLKAMADSLQDVEALEDALQNNFVRSLVESSLGISANQLLSSLDAVRSDNFDVSQIDSLQRAAEFVANYSSCIETNRFQFVENEEELEREAFRLSKLKNFFAGIVFEGIEDYNSTGSRRKRAANVDIPKHITYKIRMDVDNTMDTNKLKSNLWKFQAEDNFIEDMRYFRGFIHIQDMLDRAIIKLQKNEILDTPGARIKQMPFPCHHYDNFVFLLGAYLVPVMMTFVFLTSLGVATHNFVYDRENGQEATLGVMGMISGLNFLMWLLSTMIVMVVVCFVMTVMLKYTDIFTYSNPLILFLYLLEFCFSSLMLLYMVSAFFTRTTMAILFVLMVYLISYMPYVVLVGLEVDMEFWHKIMSCLSSTAAFSFGTLTLSYLEESGIGVEWHNLKKEVTRDFSIHWAFIMMAIDSGAYFIIGWYVRCVKPGKYGLSQPWYFPVLPSYWCSCLKAFAPRGFKPDAEPNSGPLFEPAPSGLAVGIALKNLTKKYNSKRTAVDNLSVNFYENQITSLLGHNGAAKTTTLKMLCGVLEPTSGRVMINGNHPGCGKRSIGICPQQNALFDYMTVIQHMAFYTGIKGESANAPAARAEARKLLKDVDLWHARNTPVKDLSYGMKRRLCVALAFVGRSRTIVLDEPTSGVDPHARKNIWNLITENRLGRTILLSTHHLDEADILSDRIALLHQGKLLCCGSPAFLKRCIGQDFRLTVKKAEQPAPEYDNAGDVATPVRQKNAEQTEAIKNYIQSMSPEATLVEEVGTDLTFNLPKDPASLRVPLDHFFRQLDDSLRQKQLGVDTYGVSDTTLEEVFLTLTMKADSQQEEEMGVVNPVMTTRDEASASRDPELSGSDFKNGFSRQDKLLFSPAAKIQYGPNGSGTILSQGFGNGLMTPRLTNHGLQQHEPSTRLEATHKFRLSEPGGEDNAPTGVDHSKRRRGVSLFVCQVGAMLAKRFHHYRRNWRIILSGLVLPLIFLLIAIGVSTLRVDEGDMKPLVLDPSIYGPGTFSFYQDTTKNTMSKSFTDVLTDRDFGYGSTCLRSWADEYHENETCSVPSPWYNFTKPYQMVTCQNAWQVYTEMPISYTVQEYRAASDDYMQNIDDQNVGGYLLRTFREYIDKRFGGFTFERNRDDMNSRSTEPHVWFTSKGYHAMPSYFNTMSNTVLRAQLYQDKNKSEYGITAINHPIKLGKAALSVKNLEADASDAGVSMIVVVAFSFIPCGFVLYIINERVQKERQLQNLRGISVLTYWLVAFIWDLLVYAITVGVATLMVYLFRTDGFYMRANLGAFATVLMLYGWAVIPVLYCLSNLFDSGSTAYLVGFCINLFLALATIISLLVMQLFTDVKGAWEAYKICKYAYLVFPQFALGQGLMDMVSNTFAYKLFARFDVDQYKDPYSTDVMGWNLLALACEGAFFFILALLLDGVRAPSLSLPPGSERHKDTVVSTEDVDVARERDRIRSGQPSDNMLVVDSLSKVYRRGWRKFLPVDHITFGVPEGECFGLLGVNGAGKTTTFRMLTGDSKPANGAAFLRGERLTFNDKQFGHDIGYCPQEGGLDEYLTGEETLQFHSRLKGFHAKQTRAMVSNLLQRLGLVKFANVPVHRYSGGTKRKLALAVALLGEPSILYLDEPTTGMDAVTRRLAWKCIAQANRNGQSVVLTSHSMGECDALCSRIAIMVNGQIKCIGSPQHLKNKFGDGYTVVLHATQSEVNMVTNLILNRFPGAKIKNMHVSRVELLIPYQSAQVADIVGFLQNAEEEKAIDYYSLSQTSLDSVFINFAQEQSDNYEEQISSSGGSSSWDKTDTPSGSISSQGKLPDELDDKDTARYVFANPQFIPDETKPTETSGDAYPEISSTRL